MEKEQKMKASTGPGLCNETDTYKEIKRYNASPNMSRNFEVEQENKRKRYQVTHALLSLHLLSFLFLYW